MLASILGNGLINLSDWSMSNLLNSHYNEIFVVTTHWSIEDYVNTTHTEHLDLVENLDLKIVAIGLLGCWLDFCFLFTSFMTKFLQLFHATTLCHYNTQFVALLFKAGVDGEMIEECYKFVFKVTTNCEEMFGSLLIVTHLETLFQVQIIIRNFLARGSMIPTIVASLKVIIVYCAYYYSVVSSNKV